MLMGVNPTCAGVCNGTATVDVSGGTSPRLTHGQGNPSTSQTISGLCAGIYIVSVTDANGCVSST